MNTVKVFVLLAVTVWLAHFWQYKSFGLYEDDLYRIPRVMSTPWSKVWEIILEGGGQGRPLHDGLIYLFSFLGTTLGGLNFVYLIAYVIVTVNSFLFYVLLKRLSSQEVFTLTGALAFCIFPADTTQAFLTHSLGIQPSLMFLLIALHCYLSGKRNLSYLPILGSLLCYETIYPVFLAAPLLKKKWDSRLKGELAKHTLFLGVMMVCVVIIRKLTIDRVGVIGDLSILSAIRLSVTQMVIGPIVSMAMFLFRPIKTLITLNGEQLKVLPFYLIGLVWVLSCLKLDDSSNILRFMNSVKTQGLAREIPQFFKHLAKLALIGLIMLVLAYPLTFTVSAKVMSGRGSRVHTAAVVGASILCACVCSTILSVASTYGKKYIATVGLAAFFSLLVGFGLIVQQDYRISWQYEQALWTKVTSLSPDVTDGTVILVESTDLKNRRQIEAYSWSTPVVLNSIYRFPDRWKFVPRVYRLKSHWQDEIAIEGNFCQLSKVALDYQSWLEPTPKDKVESTSVILLEAKNGQLIRRTEPLEIANQKFRLKEKPALKLPPFEKGPLYDYLIKEETTSHNEN